MHLRNVLKFHKFHPYKSHILQELGDDNPERRIQFCDLMSEKIRAESRLLKNIYINSDCTFMLKGNAVLERCGPTSL